MSIDQQLLYLAQAGATVIHIASYEWQRVQGCALGLASALGAPLHIWNQSSGMRRYESDGTVSTKYQESTESTDPIELLKQIHNATERGVWLLEDFHPFLKEEHHPVHRWLLECARLRSKYPRFILLSTPTPSLPIQLQKEIPTLELALPGKQELGIVLKEVGRTLSVPIPSDQDELLDAARGLTVMEAHLAFGKVAAERKKLDHGAVPLVAREKERIIKQSEVLEYYPTEAKLSDVGGLDQLKQWLKSRGRAFGAGAREFGLDAPKGVLLLGVQGCGKSLLAKAVAATWQFPLLRFDLGKVFGGLVGQSEGNIRAALQVAQALAPCVLWIDEIEKALAGLGSSDRTDGGTTARVFGTLLTWMQEKSAPVFVVATANRIDMLPPELLRKGRFDEIFFVDLPTYEVRKEILSIHLQKKKRKPKDFDLDVLSERSVGFSGAELEEAIREGLFDAFAASQELNTEHIKRALEKTFPLSRTMQEHLGSLRQWAKVRARLASSVQPEDLPKEAGKDPPKLKQETARNPFAKTNVDAAGQPS